MVATEPPSIAMNELLDHRKRRRRLAAFPRRRALASIIAGALAMGAALGAAVAQERRRPTAEDAEISARRAARLAAPQQRDLGRQMVRRGERISRRIQGLLDDARRERDIIRITCLNDRLTQVNVNVRTAHAHLRALEDAIDANDRSRHDHEFTILVVIDQKWEQLEREANECTGVGPYEAFGRTRVTVWVVGVPDEDPTLIMDQGILFDVVTPPPSSGMI